MGRLLLLLAALLAALLQLQASAGFLVPIASKRPVTTTTRLTRVFSTYAAPTASSTPRASAQQQQPQPAQQAQRLRFEGFSKEVGAAAGETITVVYDPRAPGLDAPVALTQQADGSGGGSEDSNYDDTDGLYGILQDREEGGAAAAAASSSAAAATAPCLLFGFDGWDWDGSERPFATPLFPGEEEGTWAASVHLPNYARMLDCAVSDGDMAFDTNGGEYFHFRVTHIQELAADGVTVRTFKQGDDGSLTPTGVLALNDPQELERMVEEELERRRRGEDAGAAVALEDGGLPAAELPVPLLLEEEEEEEEEVDMEALLPNMDMQVGGGAEARALAASGATGVTLSPQAAERAGSLQTRRAEANVMGERVGLGAVVVNDVREAFDFALEEDEGRVAATYEGPAAALLTPGQAGRALARLGLEGFGPEETVALCDRVLGGEGTRDGGLSLEGLMRLFQALDEEDCGISIV